MPSSDWPVGGATPGLVFLRAKRRQTQQVKRSELVSSGPLWPWFSTCGSHPIGGQMTLSQGSPKSIRKHSCIMSGNSSKITVKVAMRIIL